MMTFEGVDVVKPVEICDAEAYELIEVELPFLLNDIGVKSTQQVLRFELKLDGEFIDVKAIKKSDIARVRRITGYLALKDQFNEFKTAELNERVSHFSA